MLRLRSVAERKRGKKRNNAEDAVSVFTGSVNTKDVTAHYDPGKRKLITEGDAEITAVYTAGEDGGNFGLRGIYIAFPL